MMGSTWLELKALHGAMPTAFPTPAMPMRSVHPTTAHGHTVTDGGHTHTLTAQAMSTLPPYYALCFIMKL